VFIRILLIDSLPCLGESIVARAFAVCPESCTALDTVRQTASVRILADIYLIW